jgi:alkyl sulfatase BDS1-like metallo-beta-lactamase superfamily hydrolase
VSDYTLLHKYHPEDRDVNARMSLRVASELPINNREDFDTLVCGAMAELSDEAKAPEHVTYENVLRLVKQIRQSLSR